ncbi:MAG: flagellar motor protein MotB [Oscillospiraceae bacterium]|nr:flagellar motor protein MotB [Oscillospiraceae bacterium]
MARKKKSDDAPAGCPAWLATYGDMVTLVLTFFVLLFSFSTIDAEKWKTVASSLSTLSGTPYFWDGSSQTNNPIDTTPYFPPGIADLDVSDLEMLQSSDMWDELVAMVSQLIETREDDTAVSSDNTMIQITLPGDMLFDSGKADLKPGGADVLIDVMDQLMNHSQFTLPLIGMFRIEGHTDNVPQNSAQFPDNWSLSAGRAYTVLRFLLDAFPESEYPDLSESMYSYEGRGEHHPIADNSISDGRDRNRRVEFYVMRDFSGGM